MPPVGGLHYTAVVTSHTGHHLATAQGWSGACAVKDLQDGYCGTAAEHSGFISDAVFSKDGSILITVDMGHRGTYEVLTTTKNKTIIMTVIMIFNIIFWIQDIYMITGVLLYREIVNCSKLNLNYYYLPLLYNI